MSRKDFQRSLTYWFLLVAGLIVFSSALLTLLALGWHMRLSGDDYCYNAVLAQKGFWGMQPESYFNVSTFNGNRYSANLLAGLFGLFPISGSFLLIMMSLLAWLGGSVIFLRWISRRFGVKLSWLESLLIAEAFISLVLWSAPNLSQSLFWRSGALSYLSPLVGGTWVLAYVLLAGEWQKHRCLHGFLIFLAALFVGGFSETGTAFWGGFWALFLLTVLLVKSLVKWDWVGRCILPGSVALLGTLIGGVLLAISPSTAMRLAGSPAPLDFEKLIPLLALNVRVYLWINLMRRTGMVLVPILLGIGLGLGFSLSRRHFNDKFTGSGNIWKLLGGLVIVGASMLLLITAVMLPVSLIQSDYPPDRARILSQAVLTGGGMLGGTLLGVLLHRFFQKIKDSSAFWQKLLWGLSILLILTSLIAPIEIFRVGVETWPMFSRWSRLWDQRHTRLAAAGDEGVEGIRVMALDHPIKDVGELAADPGYWYNNCAETYYGVDAIIADQPGW